MSMQLKGKKRRGAAMSSEAKITKGDASEDALLTESAILGPDNPTNAGGGRQDEQEEALVIPEKTEVGEKMINETKVTVSNKFSLIRGENAYKPIGGKRRADPAIVNNLMEMWDKEEEQKKQKRTSSSLKILPS